MPEGERPKRIRTMRHRAFTKRQGCLKVNAQSASGRCATERSQRDREFVLLIKKIDFFDKLNEELFFIIHSSFINGG